jgi:capsular exopolysaccharide synthesis family protein
MSRIQNILEKAEREGGIRRVRTLTEPAGATAMAFEVPSLPDVVPGTEPAASEVVTAAPPTVPAVRALRGALLDPVLVAALAPGAATAEQYRALRTRVAHTNHDAAMHVLLITSPGRGEGKSVTAANLGLTMAQDFQTRICVVDADLRRPRLHSLFGIPDTPGLADVLTGRCTLSDALINLEDQQITLLPAGQVPKHPAELLGSASMRRTIHTLRSQFDRVIIDAPSAAPLADIGILAPLVDSVVLIVRAGVTTKPAIQEAVATIGQGRLLGIVLNSVAA